MGALDEPLAMRRHRLNIDDYHRLGEAGILSPDARVELIEGELIDLAPIGSRHWAAVARLDRLLHDAVGDRAIVAVQTALRLAPHSEPQPDLALVRPRVDFYASALPTAADALLVVEVADTTQRFDRQVKLPLYARHGVPELWLVDLEGGVLLRCLRPVGDSYAEIEHLTAPRRVTIDALPGIAIAIDQVLGA